MNIILYAVLVYVVLSILFTYLVHAKPRRPVSERPDWGIVTDITIPAVDGGFLEVWRIEPEGPSKGIVVLAHGWSRNRDRMVNRARMFGAWGYTTVIHSARDHGGSSRCRMMNAVRFGEDIEAVIRWVDEPVLLYGHSAGSAGAVVAAARLPHRIRLLFLEGSYAETKPALLSLYCSFNRLFGKLFGPAIVFWMEKVLYGKELEATSPVALARKLDVPVLLIHGELDPTFPVSYAETLARSFPQGRAQLWVAHGAGHSDASSRPGYQETIKGFLEAHRV